MSGLLERLPEIVAEGKRLCGAGIGAALRVLTR